jgi:hypothetical protein
MKRIDARLAMAGAAALLFALAVRAEDRQGHEGHQGATAERRDAEKQAMDPKAQSGAEAADEARIYTAELRRCEGFHGTQRTACVAAAKRRLGEL